MVGATGRTHGKCYSRMLSHGALQELQRGERPRNLVLEVVDENGVLSDGVSLMAFSLDMHMSLEDKHLLERTRLPSASTGVILRVQDYALKEEHNQYGLKVTSLVVMSCMAVRDRDLVLQEQRAIMSERFREMRAARAARALPLLLLLELILRKRARAISVWSTTRAVGKLAHCVTGVRARVLSFLTGDMYKCLHPKRRPRVTPMVGPVSW